MGTRRKLGTRAIRCAGVACCHLDNVGSRRAVISRRNHTRPTCALSPLRRGGETMRRTTCFWWVAKPCRAGRFTRWGSSSPLHVKLCLTIASDQAFLAHQDLTWPPCITDRIARLNPAAFQERRLQNGQTPDDHEHAHRLLDYSRERSFQIREGV